jgi:ABC-type Fe3+/spermidine/putrescine transport system ATPase subunit
MKSVRMVSPILELRKVTKQYDARRAVDAVSLQVPRGAFYSLLGPSGCGKTTTLRLIAGFEQPSEGEILLSGQCVNRHRPYERNVSTVFQSYALFPHLTVLGNVEFGLRRKSAPDIDRKVKDALALVELTGKESRYPAQLSGGERQRVALARSLVVNPDVLLLDEPLAALDPNLRKQMRAELKSLQARVGTTFLFVTHDQEEAMALSDRIALLRDGALEQVASPREIYAHPATAYTAQFIGQTNLLHGEIRRSIATCGVLRWPLDEADGPVLFSLRPETIRLSPDGKRQTHEVKFRATVRQQIYGGASELLEVDCGTGQLLRVRLPACGPLAGDHDFVFSIADAIRVAD